MMKTAIITGITGQDGSYLAELLLQKGYRVVGITNSSDPMKWGNISQEIYHQIVWQYIDVRDARAISECVLQYMPDEYYNLAAQSVVGTSWEQIGLTYDINIQGALNALEAIRQFVPHCRYYQASTAEMFGSVQHAPQTEATPFHPRSPYGVSKLSAHWTTVNYRENYGLHASCGILYNHESERRGSQFVTRKITQAVARIAHGQQSELHLGNISSKRDWGYAPDYVEGMWKMLQYNRPNDYILATGESYSVEEFAQRAFIHVGLDYKKYVVPDSGLARSSDLPELLGDASKAARILQWRPTHYIDDIVAKMVDHDMHLIDNTTV